MLNSEVKHGGKRPGRTIAKDVFGFVFILVVMFNGVLFVFANVSTKALGLKIISDFRVINNHVYKAKEELHERSREAFDIIFLGSSHAYLTFDERYLELRQLNTFNLGTGAQTPLNTYYLHNALKKTIKTKRYIIEASPSMFINSGTEAYVELLNAYHELNPWAFKIAVQTGDLKAFLFYLFWKYRLNKCDIGEISSNVAYIKGGYCELTHLWQESATPQSFQAVTNEIQFVYFRKLLSEIHSDGTPVAVVIAPTPVVYIQCFGNYSHIVDRIKEACDAYNIPFVDFNDQLHYPLEMFSDYSHLNSRGVKIFMPAFMDKMQKIGFLPVDTADSAMTK